MPPAEPSDAVPGLDLAAVQEWLAQVAPGTAGDRLKATLIAGGRSNLTYRLDSDDGSPPLVLRRPPLGHVQATAHDMAREFRVMTALSGTTVPVPATVALAGPEVLGVPCYVMRFVPGVVLRDRRDVRELGVEAKQATALAMMDVLSSLHAVSPSSVGLGDFGRPEGFMARQVRRWSTQLEGSRSRPLPGIEDLRDTLADSVPVQRRSCLVHGDYRLDNLILAPPGASEEPVVRAVLDWEMATLGDPLADLGLLLAYWDGLGGIDNPVATGVGPSAGFPPGADLLARYEQRAGALEALAWYVAFGYFKIAVILEGIHYRYAHGQTLGEGFDQIGPLVPQLVTLGRRALAGP